MRIADRRVSLVGFVSVALQISSDEAGCIVLPARFARLHAVRQMQRAHVAHIIKSRAHERSSYDFDSGAAAAASFRSRSPANERAAKISRYGYFRSRIAMHRDQFA